MNTDATEYVRKCQNFQEHSPLTRIPAKDLHNISTPWPFHTWGLDLLGPFTPAAGQLKHLIVAVDSYTKWIKLEPLARIASIKVQNFVFRQIICRFGILAEVICDNGTQFTDKEFREMLAGFYIKQYFASVEHPQSNEQVESANKVILTGLRKRFEKAEPVGQRIYTRYFGATEPRHTAPPEKLPSKWFMAPMRSSRWR
jgi:hypothetical protein